MGLFSKLRRASSSANAQQCNCFNANSGNHAEGSLARIHSPTCELNPANDANEQRRIARQRQASASAPAWQAAFGVELEEEDEPSSGYGGSQASTDGAASASGRWITGSSAPPSAARGGPSSYSSYSGSYYNATSPTTSPTNSHMRGPSTRGMPARRPSASDGRYPMPPGASPPSDFTTDFADVRTGRRHPSFTGSYNMRPSATNPAETTQPMRSTSTRTHAALAGPPPPPKDGPLKHAQSESVPQGYA